MGQFRKGWWWWVPGAPAGSVQVGHILGPRQSRRPLQWDLCLALGGTPVLFRQTLSSPGSQPGHTAQGSACPPCSGGACFLFLLVAFAEPGDSSWGGEGGRGVQPESP